MSNLASDYIPIDHLKNSEWGNVRSLVADEFWTLPKNKLLSAPERVQHMIAAEASSIAKVKKEWGELYTNKQMTELTRRCDRLARLSDALDRWSASRDAAISAINASLQSLPLDIAVRGSGQVVRNIESQNGMGGAEVRLTASADVGSKFKCWHGDASGTNSTCTITVDSAKSVSAEFVEIEAFKLTVVSTGTGTGKIVQIPFAERYIDGTKVVLTAHADAGSKFNRWGGDAIGIKAICEIRMRADLTASAEFVARETFELIVNTSGTGTGKVVRSLAEDQYFDGTNVNLVAHADTGSKFKCWHGDANHRNDNCSSVTMNSAKTVIAEFVALEFFPLNVTLTGTGSGSINRSIDSSTYFDGTKVSLTALAADGSIFNGWHGDVATMDDTITVTISSAFSISAEFVQLAIADTEIGAELVSTTKSEIKKGQFASVFSLALHNKGDQQRRIKVPLTSYVSHTGQTSEQSSWSAGFVNGSKGVSLAAGTFCEMGLVHFNQPVKGDRLYISVDQVQPFSRMSFTFQCIDSQGTFLLINASEENAVEVAGTRVPIPAMASVLKRIDSLENMLADVVLRLNAIQQRLPTGIPPNQTRPVQTLSEVCAWVAEHDQVGVAELRARLLPLDLLLGAVMDELNERALDLVGELALEEVGDLILVTRDVLGKVLANDAG